MPTTTADFDLQHLPEVSDSGSGAIAGTALQGTEGSSRPATLVAPDQSAELIQPHLGGPEALSAAIEALADHVGQDSDQALTRELTRIGRQPGTAISSDADRPGVARGTQLDQVAVVEGGLADLSMKSQELLEKQTRLFQEQLLGIVNKTLSQSDASVDKTVSRLETYFAYAKQMESEIDGKLASLTRKAVEVVQTQTKFLEGELFSMADRAGSQLAAALEPLANRIQDYRGQAEQIDSALETSLERFTQKAAEAALVQTRSFQESIASICEQHISQTKQGFESRMIQVRELAARSLEDEINSVSERLQQSHAQSIQERLGEIFEASSVKIAALEQHSDSLVRQIQTESEVIEHELHKRFKSDAEALESKLVDTMRVKLQKLTDGFRSIFDAGQQDGH